MRLHLHLHSKAYLDVLHDYASAVAFLARFQFSVFGAGSAAFVAINVPIDLQRPPRTQVQIFKCYRYVSPSIGSFLPSRLSSIDKK